MDCSELIVSQDTQDFIIENRLTELEIDYSDVQGCYQDVNENWRIGYGDLAQAEMNISTLGYQTVPKLYGLADSTNMEAAGITATLNQPYLNVAGQGVIVGFVDTGIDYTLDIFKETVVASRIGVIWDQTIQTRGEDRSSYEREFREALGEGFSYGTIYTREQINEALNAGLSGQEPYSIVPSQDEDGHGTFVAGIAAGGTDEDYTGAAPMSELAVVKLKPAKQYLRDYYLINNDAVAYQENDIMLGVSFLLRYAQLRGLPLVIYIGLSTGSGSRTGATPLGSVLSYVADIPGVAVVTAVGNEANARLHTFGRINSQEEPSQIEINVGDGEKGFVLEIWASTLDVLSISLLSPSGEAVPRIPARSGSSNIFRFVLDGSEVSVDYRVVERQSGHELIFMRFVDPAPGIWKIEVFSLTNIEGVYNAWMPLRGFLSADTFLLSSSPYITITESSAVQSIISVGAYDHITGASYADSGRGYTAEGQVKPDIVAPGVNIYGAKAGGGYTYRSGTSVAAAHVAGAAAVLFSWGITQGNSPRMGCNDVKYMLIRGAVRQRSESYPNRITGYGQMNLIDAFRQLSVI